MKRTLRVAAVALSLSIAHLAGAAHWIIQSRGDATSPISSTSGTNASRGMRTTKSATVTGGLYGSGTFSFFGEKDAFSQDVFVPYPGTIIGVNAYVNAYYTFTYKWVSDAPGDTPPAVGSQPGAQGYFLERVDGVAEGQTARYNVTYDYTAACLFNSQNGNTFTGSVGPTGGWSDNWPKSAGSGIVSVGGVLFFVSPQILPSATITLDGSGNTIATITTLNSETLQLSSSITLGPPMSGLLIHNTATLENYVAASTIGGLAVQ